MILTFDDGMNWKYKDSGAKLDYKLDFSAWLDADTISSVAWTIPSGIVQEAGAANTATTATVWLSGGTVGVTYPITCRVTTASGRVDDGTFNLTINEQ